ncbi:hypothetical protein [Micromonospora sediminimaris]|uniref:Uncharacterized protein n=1 Tax=Micromonospora sediminimaris TaxID=547162 RepID=A0A9W5URM1_9ACTN|nr:hypothetical protein [Micromonospora sediminimaris]GIJ33148.1 hypothetical protein Vse01_22960 [Micromonospora sediminimaris]
MTVLAEGVDALDLRGRTVSEVVRIADADDLLEAVQFVFVDGQSLTLTVWTDWRLTVELRSEAVVPDYLWPVEDRTRTAIEEFSGARKVVDEVVPGLNDAGILASVRFSLDGCPLLVKSFGGELILELG